jgi:hypothetical protein
VASSSGKQSFYIAASVWASYKACRYDVQLWLTADGIESTSAAALMPPLFWPLCPRSSHASPSFPTVTLFECTCLLAT